MRVLVDTSVWADFFNQADTPEALLLAQLISDEVEIVTCGVIIAEFFQGLRRAASITELESHFRDMECLSAEEPDTYFLAAKLYRDLRRKGVTVRSTIDCLIVQLGASHDALLLARDRDISLILQSGLTKARAVAI